MWQFFRQHVHRLRRLAVIAVVSFGLNFLLTVGLTELLDFNPEGAFAVALCVVFLVNFHSTRRWAFGDRAQVGNRWAQFVKCTCVSIFFRILEWVLFFILVDGLKWNYLFTLLGVMTVSFLAKSVIYDRFVFTTDSPAGAE